MADKTLSLAQFAAIEAWMEAFVKLAARAPGDNFSDLVTDVYRNRMRAMFLLTGAKPPLGDADDEAQFKTSMDALLKSVKKTGRAPPAKAIKLPREDDYRDIA